MASTVIGEDEKIFYFSFFFFPLNSLEFILWNYKNRFDPFYGELFTDDPPQTRVIDSGLSNQTTIHHKLDLDNNTLVDTGVDIQDFQALLEAKEVTHTLVNFQDNFKVDSTQVGMDNFRVDQLNSQEGQEDIQVVTVLQMVF